MVRSIAGIGIGLGLDSESLQFKSKRSFASTGTQATLQQRSFAEAGDGRVWEKLRTGWGVVKDVINSPDLSDAIGGANSVTTGIMGFERVRKAWEILATPDLRALVAELNRRERFSTGQAENFQVQETEGSREAKEMINFLHQLGIDERSIAKILNARRQSPSEGLTQMRALIQQKNAHAIMAEYLRTSLDQVQTELNLLFGAIEGSYETGDFVSSLTDLSNKLQRQDPMKTTYVPAEGGINPRMMDKRLAPDYIFLAEEQLPFEVRQLAKLYKEYDPSVLRTRLLTLAPTHIASYVGLASDEYTPERRQQALQTAKDDWAAFYSKNYPKAESSTVTPH